MIAGVGGWSRATFQGAIVAWDWLPGLKSGSVTGDAFSILSRESSVRGGWESFRSEGRKGQSARSKRLVYCSDYALKPHEIFG